MTNHNTTDGELHLFANDGTNWRSTASAVSSKEAREQDAAVDEAARQGDGPAATNEGRLESSVLEDSESENNDGEVTEGEGDESESEDPDAK